MPIPQPRSAPRPVKAASTQSVRSSSSALPGSSRSQLKIPGCVHEADILQETRGAPSCDRFGDHRTCSRPCVPSRYGSAAWIKLSIAQPKPVNSSLNRVAALLSSAQAYRERQHQSAETRNACAENIAAIQTCRAVRASTRLSSDSVRPTPSSARQRREKAARSELASAAVSARDRPAARRKPRASALGRIGRSNIDDARIGTCLSCALWSASHLRDCCW